MTTAIEKICTVEYIEELLNKYIDVDELIEKLVLKAQEESTRINTLVELEGKADSIEDLIILKKCPMANIIKKIKEKNYQKTGKKEFPSFYNKIIDRYKEKYPEHAGILHPFCIIHQAMREIIGANSNLLIKHIACQSPDTGEIAISKNGLKEAKISVEKIKKLLDGHACAYLKHNFTYNDD